MVSKLHKSEDDHFIGPADLSHITFFKSIKCHTFSESQAQADLNADDYNNDADNNDDNNNDDNKVHTMFTQCSHYLNQLCLVVMFVLSRPTMPSRNVHTI